MEKVYNFGDYRPDLEDKGHRFSTHTDTEVVLHLYDEYGTEFLTKLNGMFGLAIWDDEKKRTHCCTRPLRDQTLVLLTKTVKKSYSARKLNRF